MHKKALTVAIAGALAAPMAAQAVDFKISGHVNRALFVVDKDIESLLTDENIAAEGLTTKEAEKLKGHFGADGTKAQVANNGGSSTRIRVTGSSELEDGNKVGIQWEYQDDSSGGLGLRHANVQYSGGFGKITIGQGSEAGDGSAYSDTTGVKGIGHGAGTSSDFSLGWYFGSLDAGGRVEMIRYDTPSIGPVSAAVSVANGDRVSGLISLSSEFGGTTFGAKIATLQMPNQKGYVYADGMARDRDESTVGASVGATMASGLTLSAAWAKGKDMESPVAKLFKDLKPDERSGSIDPVDPSYIQAEVGYKFGNSGVAVSWYKSDDFVSKGSEGTALGIGARHILPKANAEVYTAVQNYDVKPQKGWQSIDETVFVVGTLVKF